MTDEPRDYDHLFQHYLERYVAQSYLWRRIFGHGADPSEDERAPYRAEDAALDKLKVELLLHPATTALSLCLRGYGEHPKKCHYDIDDALEAAFAPEQVHGCSESSEFMAFIRPENREAVVAFLAQNFPWLDYKVIDVVARVREDAGAVCFAYLPGIANWDQARQTLKNRRRQILAGQPWPDPDGALTALSVEASAEAALDKTLSALRESGCHAMAEELAAAAAAQPNRELALCGRYVRLLQAPDEPLTHEKPAEAGEGSR